jgi:hypothetical protein
MVDDCNMWKLAHNVVLLLLDNWLYVVQHHSCATPSL